MLLQRLKYHSRKLYGMFSKPILTANFNVLKFIKVGRLRWAGYVEGMKDGRVPKRLLRTNPDGRRSRGRSKLRWLDDIEQDRKTIEMRGWRGKAQDWTSWRNLLDQVNTQVAFDDDEYNLSCELLLFFWYLLCQLFYLNSLRLFTAN